MSSELEKDGEISRRRYLETFGAASVSPALLGTASAASEDDYETVVDIVEAGADDSGEEPIDDVFDEHANDDTLIKFPPGTYAANQLTFSHVSNFGMVGDDATLVPGDDFVQELWIAAGETRDVRFENFTIDNTEEGVAPEIDINAYDGLVFRNVHKRGFQDDGGAAIGLYTLTEDGHGLVENVRATDGGHSVGLYIESEGPMTVRNCHIERFADNGVYASNSTAPVTVEGGLFRNNNYTQVRLGSAGSTVRNARIVVDEKVIAPHQEVVNMKGIRIADGPGPVTIDNCDISMSNSRGSGAIVNAYSGGSFTVRDTRIYVDESFTTNGSDGSRTGYGIFVDDATAVEPGERTVENVSITGAGMHRSAMIFRRSDNTIRNVCIEQSGPHRNGIVFENSTDNTVSDSVVDVPDEEIVLRNSSVRKSGIETEGNCPRPNVTSPENESSTESEPSPVEVPGEVGSVVRGQLSADTWHAVDFARQYDDPVVISKPTSYDWFHPCHVRVRDVTPDGYDFQLEEWLYLDGLHPPETAHYLALAGGSYELDGLAVDVGRFSTDNEFTNVGFDRPFDRPPVVFTQSQTRNGTDPIVTRQRNVSATGTEVRLVEEEGEANGGYHYDETVGYVAVEPGSGRLGGRPFEVGFADDGVDEEWYRIEFDGTYENPRFVADIQSYNGPNTVNLRYRNLTGSSVEVFLDEERSADLGVGHRYERVGYAVVDDG